MMERVERGLTSDEARARLLRNGPNRLVPERRRSPLVDALARAFSDPMVLLLLVAGSTYLVLRDLTDAIVALAALVPIVAIDLALEARAEHALDALERLSARTAVVRRDGRAKVIPAEEVVPGDILILQEGDVVPADGSLLSGSDLMVDESSLTGESQPVAKDWRGSGTELEALAGTTVLSGRGTILVLQTGAATRYGQIGALVAGIRQTRTPLEHVIARLVSRLGVVALGFCVAVVGSLVLRGSGWGQAIIAGIALGIAAIPEEFPMVFTLYLALGAWRLAKDEALVRRLAGVETLGSTTVIATDKTGTLTLGHLEVAGLAQDGDFVQAGTPLDPGARSLLNAALLASEPDPFDPLEQAIARFAVQNAIDVDELHSADLIHDYPFDPAEKYVSHVWGTRIYAKGAIEGILRKTNPARDVRRSAEDTNRALAARGMRVLAVAEGDLPEPSGQRAEDERPLRFVGLIAFSDPIRPGVTEALRECNEAGIRVIMITGDHPETAHAVADGLGLPHDHDGAIVLGDQLESAPEDELPELVSSTNLFARTRPEHKYRLVRALRSQGHVVAMTGDGINDAPALREADIGVAMGRRGTEVAREAATMVLLDDDFTTIVVAVRDGRRIFENLRRAFTYLIAFHVPLLLGALLIPLVGKPLLLLPVHLVLLELVLHPTISLVFENDPPSSDLMRRPPRRPTEGLLSRGTWVRPLSLGLSLTAGVLGLYLVRLAQGADPINARSLAFATLLLGQGLLVLVERSPDAPIWRTGLRGNRALIPVLIGIVLVLLASFYVPVLTDLLRLQHLSLRQWGFAAAVTLVSTLWFEPLKARKYGRASERSLSI
jgi:Ca2+-transporting ATPase